MLRRVGTLSMFFGAVAFGLLSTMARADVTAPQTVTIAATDTNFGPGTALNDPMVFNQFNSSLGTLTSVSVSVSYDFNHTSTLTFAVPSTISTSATQNNISVSLPNGTVIGSAASPDYTQSTAFNSSTMTLGTPVTLTPINDPGTIAPISLTSASNLALFTGSGTISLPVLASSVAAAHFSAGNGTAVVTTTASATVTISYNYTPHAVPEPSSVVLLGMGGCGLLWFRRRRAA